MNTDIDMAHHGLNAVGTIDNIDTATGTNTPVTVSSALQGASGGPVEVQNGLDACAGAATGCNLAVSSNGAFYDENDGWIRYRGPATGAGLALDGNANNLYVGGTTTSMGQIQGYGGVALKGNTSISWPDITGAYLGADSGSGFLHVFGGGLAVDGDIDGNGSVRAAGDMSAGGNLGVGGSIYASGAIGSGTSVSAGEAMYAPVYYDSTNSAYYVQPSGTSMLNSVVANSLTVNGAATVNGTLNANAGANVSGDLNVSNAIFAGQVEASNGVSAAQGFDGGPASFYALPSNPSYPALAVFGNGGVTGNMTVDGTLCTPRGCY